MVNYKRLIYGCTGLACLGYLGYSSIYNGIKSLIYINISKISFF